MYALFGQKNDHFFVTFRHFFARNTKKVTIPTTFDPGNTKFCRNRGGPINFLVPSYLFELEKHFFDVFSHAQARNGPDHGSRRRKVVEIVFYLCLFCDSGWWPKSRHPKSLGVGKCMPFSVIFLTTFLVENVTFLLESDNSDPESDNSDPESRNRGPETQIRGRSDHILFVTSMGLWWYLICVPEWFVSGFGSLCDKKVTHNSRFHKTFVSRKVSHKSRFPKREWRVRHVLVPGNFRWVTWLNSLRSGFSIRARKGSRPRVELLRSGFSMRARSDDGES